MRQGTVKNPHIVRDFMIGNTRIRIADDFCRDKTKEDVQEILDHIAELATNAMIEKAMREKMQEG